MDEWPCHTWNVNDHDDPACRSRISRNLSDYYQQEELSVLPRNTNTNTNTVEKSNPPHHQHIISRAYPRHHALILAARCSSSKLVSREFPFVTTGYERGCSQVNGSLSRFAYARVHDPEHVSIFTEQLASVYQKHHLTGLAGLTGLLVTRLMDHRNPENISVKKMKTRAEITKQYLHSALAAECLIGNRYYRKLTLNRRRGATIGTKHPVGFIACNAKENIAANDITPLALRATQDELRESYNANIDRLLLMIEMFKRGFVSINQIREDPEFVRLMTAFWRSGNQLMKMKEDFENQAAPLDPINRSDYPYPSSSISFVERKHAKRVHVISLVAEPSAIAPKLFDYDIAHVFDNASQSYANYVKVTKHTLARLACDGSVASFLAFAAIEPGVVTEDCAPRIGGMVGEYHGIALKACANYIPSRDPVFGALRVKHRCHIMRTADAVNTSSERVHPRLDAPQMGVTRTNARFGTTYAPFYEVVEDIRNPDFKIDILRTFPETHQNTGMVITASEATDEFKERVFPFGMAEIRRRRGSIDDYDDDDDYYYYNHDDDDDREEDEDDEDE